MEDFALRLLFEDEQAEPCEQLESLCTEIRNISEEHRQRFWNLVRMPITPATVVSLAASAAAWMEALRQEWAYGATAVSMAFGYCKVKTYMEKRADFLQTRKMIDTQIRMLLPNIHERDILQARLLLDEMPELKEGCSNCQ